MPDKLDLNKFKSVLPYAGKLHHPLPGRFNLLGANFKAQTKKQSEILSQCTEILSTDQVVAVEVNTTSEQKDKINICH